MDVAVGRAGFAVKKRDASVRICTGGFTVVATDTKRIIDQQYIGCFANTLLNKKSEEVVRLALRLNYFFFVGIFAIASGKKIAQVCVALEHLDSHWSFE